MDLNIPGLMGSATEDLGFSCWFDKFNEVANYIHNCIHYLHLMFMLLICITQWLTTLTATSDDCYFSSLALCVTLIVSNCNV